MSHLPVNHHLRPAYRVVAGLTGGWLVTFGIAGWVETAGGEWFGQGDWSALGLPTNRAFAMVSILVGAVVLTAALVGRNIDQRVNFGGGVAFTVAGTLMLIVSHTDLNVFNASIATVMVSYVIGTVLLAAGLYGKVGPAGSAPASAPGATGTSSGTDGGESTDEPELAPAGRP